MRGEGKGRIICIYDFLLRPVFKNIPLEYLNEVLKKMLQIFFLIISCNRSLLYHALLHHRNLVKKVLVRHLGPLTESKTAEWECKGVDFFICCCLKKVFEQFCRKTCINKY